MSTLRDDIGNAVRGATCWIADQAATGANAGIDFLTRSPNRGGALDDARDYWQDRVGRARDSICNDGPTSGQLPPPPADGNPFAGGQCAEGYRIQWVWDRYFNNALAAEGVGAIGTQIVTGPIADVRISSTGRIAEALLANGNVVALSSNSSNSVNFRNMRDIVVELADGSEDDCGDRPGFGDGPMPIWTDPRPNPVDPNAPDIPIDIFPPRVDVGPLGDIEFCFRVRYGVLEFEVCYSPGYGDPEGTPSDPVRECCPDIDTNSPPAPPTDSDPPDPQDTRQILGVVTSFQSVPGNADNVTERGDGIGPSSYFPSVAELRFGVKTPVGPAWSEAYKIRAKKEWHPAPEGVPSYTWVVDEWKGVPITVTPVYTEVVQPPEEI